ncbi:MAG: transcription termination factor NusA [Planctomycetes bacterium]|nr:transcription termination factor NusA [Planctomycetota bacterium]
MNPTEILRIVDSLQREKNIDPEIVFTAIEAALVSAAKGYYGEEDDIDFQIDRESGVVTGHRNGEPLDAEETIGRIGAQRAKQVIIQKIREAERDQLMEEYREQLNHLVSGVIQRNEGGAATVALGNVEAILPRSEQIPGETHHPNERIRAVVCEVRAQGNKVKVILSRARRELVARLFEQEIPEISEGIITVEAISREAGQRSKVAVRSSDQRVDCVGACVGVRGNRIKNIIDELAGERIDIVRYSDDPLTLISNALAPAEVDQVILCPKIGRAIVLVREDQLSLAIGRRGQNVRLASKLCGWDIEIMTQEELEDQAARAMEHFGEIEGVTEELADKLVGEGYLSYDDLSVIEPDELMELGGLTEEEVESIVNQAEEKAEEAERAAADARRRQREEKQAAAIAAAAAEAAGVTAPEAGAEGAEEAAAATEEEAAESPVAEATPAAAESETEAPAEEAAEAEQERPPAEVASGENALQAEAPAAEEPRPEPESAEASSESEENGDGQERSPSSRPNENAEVQGG